ncbi:hypothetical protein FMEXI_5538 [Fusarium mexicanum]|uniref:Prion-inhibition and propagation HeLo domain-containing protein n=1 Tax=Fusarium mexicanum TaxID=751941 RepID=A0A8H5MY13_9HYPO|nr:hypothetical protein FMEXI_5538 [Fusarium mexicanum]
MEVAGLTIGAVALVSLFKDCVDLFSMITAARDLGKYAAILDTKLDVEKMLFLQWSDRVGLLKQDSTDSNAVLCNPDTRHIVSRVLESVKALLSENKALQRDYGLKRVDESVESTTGYQGASSFRFRKFLKQFEELKIKPDTDRHSNFKVTKKFRWIIVDKEKFNSLIDHLSYFNTSLNNLIPISSDSEVASSKNDLVHIKDLAELDLVIEVTSNTRPSVSEAAIAAKSALISSRVIRSLWFHCLRFQILEYDPSVTERALPHMWREACYSQDFPELEVPFIDEMAIALKDTVASDPYMRSLSHQSRFLVDRITHSLAQKASGVFLWAILACRSVVEGCDDFCTITELETRVDEVPKELEDLIEHMLENIDPRWKLDAMKLMHFVYTNEGCHGFDPIPTLGQYLTHERGLGGETNLSGIRPKQVNLSEMEAQCRVMEGRLLSRCCGLLEVHYGHRDESNIEDCIVKFMHRTVYDMLLQPEISNRLFKDLQRENFNNYAVLSEIWCRIATTTPSDSDDIFFNALYPLVVGNSKGCPPAVTLHLLSRLQFVFGQLSLSPWLGAPRYLRHDEKCRRYCNDFSLALTLAIEMGLDNVARFVFESSTSLNSLLFHHPDLTSLGDCQSTRRSRNSGHQFSCQKDGQLLETAYPLLYHAIVRPFRSDYFAYDPSIPKKASLSLARLIMKMQMDLEEKTEGPGVQSAAFLGVKLNLQVLDQANSVRLLREIDTLVSFDDEDKDGWQEVRRFCEEQLKDVSFRRNRLIKQPPGTEQEMGTVKRGLNTDDSLHPSRKRKK